MLEGLEARDKDKVGELVDEMSSVEFQLVFQQLGAGHKILCRKLMTAYRGTDWVTVKEAESERL